MTETGRLHRIEYHMQQKGAENVEQAKNTILLVRGTAAEPAALSAFTAAQPDVQLQTISGLDEAGAALERLRPTLIVLQSDAPDAQALHRCAELAETAEAVFLLLVRQEAYGAAWRTLQKHGVCVMTWPMEQAVLTQTLRNLLLLKKSMQTMAGPDRPAALTAAGSQAHPEGKGPAHASARHDGAGRAPLD